MDALLELDDDILHPPWSPVGRAVTLGLVSVGAKVVMHLLNRVSVDQEGLKRFRELTMQREPGVGLLTYSNHTSTFDDPGLPSALLPWWMFWGDPMHGKMRWTMCASDVCFVNEMLRQFFLSGKAWPIVRGASVHQPVIGVAGRRLGAGDWMHVFPEGRVQPAGDVGAFRQGIGKLVCDARAAGGGKDPIVLPFFHSGMAHVMPYYSGVLRAGNEVTVVVGEPVELGHITCRCNQPGEDQEEVWRDIAAVLRESLLQLEKQAPPNPNQLEERPGLREEIILRTAGGSSNTSSSGGSGLKGNIGLVGAWADGAQQVAFSNAVIPVIPQVQPCPVEGQKGGWCHVLQRPYWYDDQERRQARWAEWRQQQQQQQEHAMQQEGVVGEAWEAEQRWQLRSTVGSEAEQQQAVGRWRWLLWRRKRQLLQQGQEVQQWPHRQWSWSWRRQGRQLEQQQHERMDQGNGLADQQQRDDELEAVQHHESESVPGQRAADEEPGRAAKAMAAAKKAKAKAKAAAVAAASMAAAETSRAAS